MTDHADLTARLRAWDDNPVWPGELHDEAIDLIDSLSGDVARLTADFNDAYGRLDDQCNRTIRAERERDEALAEVAQLRDALERSAPWLDYLAAHVAVDWSPPEEAVMRRDAEFVRSVLAVSEEATDG